MEMRVLKLKIHVWNYVFRFISITIIIYLALFSSRTESDNPDTTCELSPKP